MSGCPPNVSNKGFLSATNTKHALNLDLEHPRTTLSLAEKKATKEKSTKSLVTLQCLQNL